MDEKSLSLDLLTKCSNLCRVLTDEKNERLISQKLFSSACTLSEISYSVKNPSLSKAENTALRKQALLEYDKVALYLKALHMSGFISLAQHDSVIKTLDILKKEINI